MAALLVPWLALAVLEVTLRLAGSGYPTSFFIHHPAAAAGKLVENYQFDWRFCPPTLARTPEPIELSSAKAPGACRIFVFGESAAIGDPAPAFGFSRILEVLLRDRYPETHFEIVNTAFTAINSHVILPIARDCRSLQGDVWLVYMGNNEVIGPFGTGTVLGQNSLPLPWIRLEVALKTSRLAQFLDALLQRLRPTSEAAQGWGGMSMFLNRQVPRDDPRLGAVRRHFQRNLEDLMTQGRSSGARLIVSTMVSNLRDWPPFASMHRPDLSPAQRAEWDRIYQAGITAETTGDPKTASQRYVEAAHLDDQFAELHFRWARCCLALGQPTDAQTHFALARDLDTLRFRTDSGLNELIRQTVATQPGPEVRLLDAERTFAKFSTNGIPGREWLFEHVHFTFAGNYLLARLFADEMVTLLPVLSRAPTAPRRDWLSAEVCAAKLGFGESERYEIARVVRRRFEEPVYRSQLDYTNRLQRLEGELADLRGYAKPVARRAAVSLCRRALALTPDDWVLHELTARMLEGVDDMAGAEAEWREVQSLIPHSARPYTELGKLQLAQGKLEAALASLTQAITVNPVYAEAYVGLGHYYRRRGEATRANACYRRALRLDPTQAEASAALR